MPALKRLGTDYVDLYQIHRFDHQTPIEETLEALHDVVKAGKARYIGGVVDVRVAVLENARCLAGERMVSVRLHAEPPEPVVS